LRLLRLLNSPNERETKRLLFNDREKREVKWLKTPDEREIRELE